MKKKAKQSLRQKWHTERGWSVMGVLSSVEKKLENVAELQSILPMERSVLRASLRQIKKLHEAMKDNEMKELSWKLYKRREK
jgi:hypothetical protein